MSISTLLLAGSLGEIAVSRGLVSAYPIAENRDGENLNRLIIYLTTEEALDAESSQLEGYFSV